MAKIKDMLIERRRYIRLQIPVNMTYVAPESNKICSTVAKNISADGLRFETVDKDVKPGGVLELKLSISGVSSPVHAKAKVIWKKKLSLEDAAPFNVGLEFTEIEDDNKNTFLKFLCDLLYSLSKEAKNAAKKA